MAHSALFLSHSSCLEQTALGFIDLAGAIDLEGLAKEIRCRAWAAVAQASDALISAAAVVEVRGPGLILFARQARPVLCGILFALKLAPDMKSIGVIGLLADDRN